MSSVWWFVESGEESDDLWRRGYLGISMCLVWILDGKEKEDSDIIHLSSKVIVIF